MLDDKDKPAESPQDYPNPEPPQYPADRIEKGDTTIPRERF